MKNIFVIITILFLAVSCKKKELPIVFSSYDESSEISEQQNHEIERMKFKLIQSKFLDMDDVFKPFEEDLAYFSEKDYYNIEPYIIEKDIPSIQESVANGILSYEKIVLFYLYRIRKFESNNELALHSIITLNSNVIKEARSRDKSRPKESKYTLYGLPILLKDNINTIGMPTTAGAFALKENSITDDAFIVTGGDVSTPIKRNLQDRLDDRVSGRSFGLTGQTSQIATAKLQTAIDQLYLNSATKGSAQSKIVLHLEAGEYIVDGTIYIPPYATIVGAGSGKTIIRTSTASTTIFKTVNSNSTPGAPATDASTTSVNQATDIRLEGVTLETTVPNKGLILENCKDSVFRDVEVTGPWVSGNAVALTDVGIEMNSLSGTVETKNNIFENGTQTIYIYLISKTSLDGDELIC